MSDKKEKKTSTTSTSTTKKPNKCLLIVNFFNGVQVLTWLITFCLITTYIASIYIPYPQLNEHSQKLLELLIIFVKIAQTAQISDFILALCGCSNNQALFSFIQVGARLITVYFFMNQQTPVWLFGMMLIPWSIGDTVRPLYNLIKDNYTLAWLRYTLFMINYPIGASGEVILMELKLKEDDFKQFEYPIRVLQVLTMLGMIYLYTYLLSQRKKALKALNEKEKGN